MWCVCACQHVGKTVFINDSTYFLCTVLVRVCVMCACQHVGKTVFINDPLHRTSVCVSVVCQHVGKHTDTHTFLAMTLFPLHCSFE